MLNSNGVLFSLPYKTEHTVSVHRISLDPVQTVTFGAPSQVASSLPIVAVDTDRHSLYYTNE